MELARLPEEYLEKLIRTLIAFCRLGMGQQKTKNDTSLISQIDRDAGDLATVHEHLEAVRNYNIYLRLSIKEYVVEEEKLRGEQKNLRKEISKIQEERNIAMSNRVEDKKLFSEKTNELSGKIQNMRRIIDMQNNQTHDNEKN